MLRARALLREQLGEAARAKTSGSVGLHVYAPWRGGDAKAYARTVAEQLASARPDLVVATQRRSARAGRVLVDWLQNEPTRQTVARTRCAPCRSRRCRRR